MWSGPVRIAIALQRTMDKGPESLYLKTNQDENISCLHPAVNPFCVVASPRHWHE